MKIIVVVLVVLSVTFKLEAAPRNHNCLLNELNGCKLESGPVCGIDASGITETFENQCMAYILACHRDTFFVEVKPGEC